MGSVLTSLTSRACLFQEAVGNRVTVMLPAGGSVRMALLLAPSSQLASSCLEALLAALPGDIWWHIFASWLAKKGVSASQLSRDGRMNA
jgi:hypothetical protein